MNSELSLSPMLTSSRRPKLTAARRRTRRLLAALLSIFYAAVILLGIGLWQGQQMPDWGLMLSPEQLCQQTNSCYWQITNVKINTLTEGSPLVAGSWICAYYPSQSAVVNKTPSFVSVSTTESDLTRSFGFIVAASDGGPCDTKNSSKFAQTLLVPLLEMIVYITIALASGLMAVLIYLHATRRQLVGRAVIALSGLAIAFLFAPMSATGNEIFGSLNVIATTYFAPPFLMSLIWMLVLPEPAAGRRWRKWIDAIITVWIPAACAALAGLYFINIFVQSYGLDPFNFLAQSTITFSSLVIALLAGIAANFASRSPLRRDSLRILGAGLVIALVPLLAFTVIPSLVNNASSVTNTYLATLTVIALPLALAYVVLRTDILGVDSLIRTSTNFALRVLGVIVVAVLFFAILVAAPIHSDARIPLLLAAMILVGLLSPAIQAGMSWFTEALIFPEVRRFRRLLARAASGTGVAEPREIAAELIGEVRLALPVRQVALFVRNNETGRFVRVPDDADPDAPLTIFEASHLVPVLLQRRSTSISAAEIADQAASVLGTSHPSISQYNDPTSGWDLFVPVRVRDDLIGFLALGPRDDEYTYSSTDRSLLLTLVNRRALALDYARVLADLRQAYEHQKELDRLKDQFIMTTHHELRTPLTGLLGYLELLRDMGVEGRQRSPQDVDHFVDAASRAGGDLERLMTTLLEADQQTINRAKMHPELLDVQTAIQTAAESADMAFDRRQRRIVIRCEPDLKMWADSQAISRVLTNLMTNALKYSPPDSPVLVSGHRHHDAEMVEILVRDWGSGIAPEDQPKIFERFVRLERDLNSPVRGTGLGLYVARALIESMGGRLWVESEGIPGVGSTFRMVLPINAPLEGTLEPASPEEAGAQSRPATARSGV